MKETETLVREMLVSPEYTALTEHQKRLEGVLGQVVKRTEFDEHRPKIEELREMGFSAIVTTDFALKFRNHASIRGDCVGKQRVNFDIEKISLVRNKVYRYAGDIPEFALSNIAVSKRAGIRCISVHSMDALPIMVERMPRMIDPVAIGWLSKVEFGKWFIGGWKVNQPAIGLILAIWDGDKEIPILG